MNSRRGFLALTAGAMAVKTVPPMVARAEGTTPDAELIAVCAEFDVCERRTCIIHGTGPDCIVDDTEANVASAPVFARMHALLDRMDELRATTPAGIQARAHSLAQHGGHGQYSFDCDTSMVGRLLAYLMRDSAALGGSPASMVAPAVSPDADLLEACAAFDDLERRYLATDFEADSSTAYGQAVVEEQRRCFDAQVPLLNHLVELRATTLEGHRARARSLALWDAELLKDGDGDFGECLTAAIVRDLLAGSAGV